ncbi:MAG TPA: hypothetical protein VGA61_01935 [Anaerolineae bacterium]
MRVFIGGVIQGSRDDNGIEDQNYRRVITAALAARWPGIEVIDPVVLHPQSPTYDDAAAKETLLALAELAAASDVVIAYLPVASMGTALEMYLAYQQGVPVLAITPMVENWVVRVFSRRVFRDLDAFLNYVATTPRLEG